MTYQSESPLSRLNLDASNTNASSVSNLIEDNWLILDPPYQRGDVWTPAQRLGLIRSLLMGLPIPAIVLNDRANTGWIEANGGVHPGADGKPFMAVVDGKQRITTLHMWFTDALAVPASWFAPEDIAATETTDDGDYVRFSGLVTPTQRDIKYMCTLPRVTSKVSSVEAEADLYLLLNGGGTPQSDADMMRATAYSSDAQA